MRKAWEIGLNSLRIALKNRQVQIFSLIMPIGFTWIMGAVMGGSRTDAAQPVRFTALYVDADRSDLSQRLLTVLQADERFQWAGADDRDAAVGQVRAGKAAGAVLVPAGFAAALRGTGPKAQLSTLATTGDARAAALYSALNAAVIRLGADAGAADAVLQGLRAARRSPGPTAWEQAFAKADAGWAQPLPASMRSETVGSEYAYTGNAQASMGFLVTFLMFSVAFGAGSILEERQSGTWGRLLTTPTSRSAILGGKLIGTVLLGILQIIALVAFGDIFLGVPWGRSPLGVTLVLAAFLWAATGVGLLLAGLVKSSAQLGAVVPIVMISTAMLGGAYWPLEIVPRPMQLLAYATPHAWAMQGLTDLIARGQPLTAALLPVMALLAYGSVAFAIGVTRVRYE